MDIYNYLVCTILIVFAFAVVYFPKKNQEKIIKKMQDELNLGDKVIVYSGLSGTIEELKEDKVIIKTEPDNVRITIEKWAVAGIDEKK